MRRLLVAFCLAAIAAVSLGSGAEAHALVRSSVPSDGAMLDRAPSQVSITFTERPDVRLSIIHVLDAGGRQVERGRAQATADPLTLTVALPSLPNGVYTVSWRTVSAVDGHVAAGAFAFGVGASPAGVAVPAGTSAPSTPPPSPVVVAGRWIFDVGLAFLLGASWLMALVFRARPTRLLRLAGAGVGAAVIGLLVAAEGQREAAGISAADFVSTSLGANLVVQLLPVAAAGITLALAWRAAGAVARLALPGIGVMTLAAILVHAVASHAPASAIPWLAVPAQALHLTAFAVWIGGLGALLVGVRGLDPGVAAQAVRRFSFVAGFALAAVAITGLIRAVDEVGSVPLLVSTLVGGLVLVKVALFLVLAGLGAVNRYRNVPAAEFSLAGLRRVSSGELGVAAVAVAVAALLTSLAPPSFTRVSAASPPQQVTAGGADFGTTVKVALTAAPGYPGSNRFIVSLHDYDTGQPVRASRVALRFTFPGRPGVGASMLELRSSGAGSYLAQGANLSLAGRWSVTVVVERGLNSTEVPLSLTTAAPAEHIQINSVPGSYTLYTVGLPRGRSVQFYVDPATAGFNQVHATFFDSKGNELPIADGTVISGTPDTGPTLDLPVTRLSAGHFVGQAPLDAGRWRFDITVTMTDGAVYQAYFEETIKP